MKFGKKKQKITRITVSTTYDANQTEYLLKQIGGVKNKSRQKIGREIGEHVRSLINIIKSGTLVLTHQGITHQIVTAPPPPMPMKEDESKARDKMKANRESRKKVGAPPRIVFTDEQMSSFRGELEEASNRMRKKIEKRFESGKDSIHIREEMKDELEKIKNA